MMSSLASRQGETRGTRDEFTAYGQASLAMARGIFDLLLSREARLFASIIPRDVRKPDTYKAAEYLRKDHVFLLERYFAFLEHEREHGLLVMDEVEKIEDRRFVRRLERYFRDSSTGRFRSQWIVPCPMFVASDMAHGVQAADVSIYCINLGFRIPSKGLNGPVRPEIADEFGRWLAKLQFEGDLHRDGAVFREYGIVYVPDPYSSRA